MHCEKAAVKILMKRAPGRRRPILVGVLGQIGGGVGENGGPSLPGPSTSLDDVRRVHLVARQVLDDVGVDAVVVVRSLGLLLFLLLVFALNLGLLGDGLLVVGVFVVGILLLDLRRVLLLLLVGGIVALVLFCRFGEGGADKFSVRSRAKKGGTPDLARGRASPRR